MNFNSLKTTVSAAALSIALAVPAFAAGLSARVDSGTVAQGDTFQLTLTTNGQADASPDLTPLQKDFEVLGTSQSSSTQIINGKRSQSESWIVSLSPKSMGTPEIPAITAGSLSSSPVAIKVVDAGSMPKATGTSAIDLSASLKDGNPFLFQETPLTVRIETSAPIKSAELVAPQSSAFELVQRGEDRVSQATRNGQTVNVIERTYMLKPQEKGAIEIPPFVLRGSVADPSARGRDPFADFQGFPGFPSSMFNDMFDSGKPFAVRSEPIKLTVRADPNAASGQHQWFLPAKNVKLTAKWSPEHPVFKEGEAVTRRVSLLALGASTVQLPDLSFENTDGARIYLDDTQTGEDQTADGTVARKDFLVSVVPTRGGEITLPEIKVNWTDSVSGEAKTATLPSEVIKAEGTIPPANQTAAAQKAAPASPVKPQGHPENTEVLPAYMIAGLGGAAVLAALGGVALYLRRKQQANESLRKPVAANTSKQEERPDTSSDRRKQLALAISKGKSGDLRGSYGCVLAWRRLAGGDPAMTDAAREAIAALEKAAFAPVAEAAEAKTHDWLNVLAREDRKIGNTQGKTSSKLPSLYPA
ncbi:BatD family protein [Agrobacterium sp. CNPSo 3708]|uniref:BatD family protein n=1 Tax=Agrobacterium sp. CNPSo 3708 TaxID=3028150 RepID=UPI0023637667|nr:BatD family protein [Agrobacterium sp. CNPSo 3708]MDD1499350.1 BatD family protein [Agrobacterium sp. CNPSo 3708]